VKAAIRSIEYHLPVGLLTNEQLARDYPDWSMAKIEEKTGISSRHITAADEYASDLAVAAAEKLFRSGVCARQDVDYLLLCTQSPDYLLPTTACILQDRLGLSTSTGALDFNLGCSGFIYGLGLAKGLIETGQARNVLLITAETYSKFIEETDRNVRTLFGDAAAATLVQGLEEPESGDWIGPFVYGTDGKGAPNLMVRGSGVRNRTLNLQLYMNGPEIFTFTLSSVPKAVEDVLRAAAMNKNDVDLYVFHQANRYMLEHLRKKIGIPDEKFPVSMKDCGNTVSSTIPIALRDAADHDYLKAGQRVVLVGFGVGYSWGGAVIRWAASQ